MPGRDLIPALVEGVLRVAAALLVLILSGLAIDTLLRFAPYLQGPWNWVGMIPIVFGAVLEAMGTVAFWRYGEGIPQRAAPPRWLVWDVLYAYTSNPLYLARFTILLGSPLLFASIG